MTNPAPPPVSPTPLSVEPIQVELTLQDYFFAESGNDPAIPPTPPQSATPQSATLPSEPPPLDRPISLISAPTSAPIAPELWQTWFQCWLTQFAAELPASSAYELSLRLTDDAEIQTLNAQYREQDHPTDVLAFAALEVDCPQPDDLGNDQVDNLPLYLGDIVISVETAQRQAEQLGHSLKQELAWLAAHALLHLLGWDHPDQASLVRMLKQQEFLLQTIGLPIDYHQIEKSAEQEYLDTEPCKV